MVANAGADEDVFLILPATCVQEVVRGLNHLLGLDPAPRRLDVAESIFLLPVLTLAHPRRAGGLILSLDQAVQGSERMLSICPNRNGGGHHFAKCRSVNVDMDDTASPIQPSCLCLRCVLVHHACGTVIKPAPHSDDTIGILDGKVGVGGTMHSKHMHGKRVSFIVDTHCMNGRCHWRIGLLHHLAQDVRAMIGALADVEDRLLCLVDEICRLLDLRHVHHGWCVTRVQR
mmetsp:Transcript_22192/g.55493  ORF Transcript_22192/g.55493 Transcript_22192/m.55493 type:complete len:230 (+) Transcript_22192:772-1461(+)